MKRSIFATLIALLMSVGSAYALTLDELRSAIQLCNLECPQQVEDGLSIQSYKMDNDNIYITYLVTDDELFACIKIIKDRAAEIMAEGLVGEKDMQYILSSCVEHHINFVFKFTDKSNTDTLSCPVPYNKIAEMLGTPSTSSSTSTSSRTELDLLIRVSKIL